MALVLGFAVVVMMLPSKARSQLGLDPCCAIISVGLSTISNLLNERCRETTRGNPAA